MPYIPSADVLNRPVGLDTASGLTLELQSLKQKLAAVDGNVGAQIQAMLSTIQTLTEAVTSIQTTLATSIFLPGSIQCGPFSFAPNGWLLLDGTEYNRADYQNLWDAISTNPATFTRVDDSVKAQFPGAFTNGDGTTTFRVPDMRDIFVRGHKGMNVSQLSAGIGELQMDALLDHFHTYLDTGRVKKRNAWDYGGTFPEQAPGGSQWAAMKAFGNTSSPIDPTQTFDDNTLPVLAKRNEKENLVRNVAWTFIVKY